MTDVWLGWSLVQMGTTMSYDSRRGAELAALPAGEAFPPGAYWMGRLSYARSDDERVEITQLATDAWQAWIRRPAPPPQGETLDELKARVLRHEGWDVRDVAIGLRCTRRFVRAVRVEHERNPETGRAEGSLLHARELLAQGNSLRQVAMLTGIPKSTLSDALAR